MFIIGLKVIEMVMGESIFFENFGGVVVYNEISGNVYFRGVIE